MTLLEFFCIAVLWLRVTFDIWEAHQRRRQEQRLLALEAVFNTPAHEASLGALMLRMNELADSNGVPRSRVPELLLALVRVMTRRAST